MVGGRYITCFPDDKERKLRIFLYNLENLGIVRISREKEKDNGWYKYQWDLTEKGKNLLDKNEDLQKLWKEKKIVEFYKLIKILLEE